MYDITNYLITCLYIYLLTRNLIPDPNPNPIPNLIPKSKPNPKRYYKCKTYQRSNSRTVSTLAPSLTVSEIRRLMPVSPTPPLLKPRFQDVHFALDR